MLHETNTKYNVTIKILLCVKLMKYWLEKNLADLCNNKTVARAELMTQLGQVTNVKRASVDFDKM